MQLQILLLLATFVSGTDNNWSCPACTFENVNRSTCEMCDTKKELKLDPDTALKKAIEDSMRESSKFVKKNILNNYSENPQSGIFTPELSVERVMENFFNGVTPEVVNGTDFATKTKNNYSSIEQMPPYGVKILNQFDKLRKDGKISHVILVDLDNWGCFFKRIRNTLPEGTFVSGYHNGSTFKTPTKGKPGFAAYEDLREKGMLEIQRCQQRKDAADFNICIRAGQLDILLGVHIPISVLSGDHGFEQIKDSGTRHKFYVVDPRSADPDVTYAKLLSIGEQSSINK